MLHARYLAAKNGRSSRASASCSSEEVAAHNVAEHSFDASMAELQLNPERARTIQRGRRKPRTQGVPSASSSTSPSAGPGPLADAVVEDLLGYTVCSESSLINRLVDQLGGIIDANLHELVNDRFPSLLHSILDKSGELQLQQQQRLQQLHQPETDDALFNQSQVGSLSQSAVVTGALEAALQANRQTWELNSKIDELAGKCDMSLVEQPRHSDFCKASSNLLVANLSDLAQRTAQVIDRFNQVSLEQPAGSDPAPSEVVNVLGAWLHESLNTNHAAVFELLGKQDIVIASIHDLLCSITNKDNHPVSSAICRLMGITNQSTC